ncbi:hypothetical protein LX36DRAFT_714630 [Colletotrichum falcatum]|nr:hypothetical protein LX36DRAFT_714630 [Colletotrichum falcatum]
MSVGSASSNYYSAARIQLASLADEDSIISSKDVAAVKQNLSEKLPPYMLPEVWAVVEGVSLMPSSKVDRRIVTHWTENPDMETYTGLLNQGRSGDNIEDTSAKNEVEATIHRIWSQVLKLPCDVVGTQSSFLSLGGDSITAMQVMPRCRAEGITVNIWGVLRGRTLSQLARVAKVPDMAVTAPVVPSKESTEPFALSLIRNMYFSQLATQGSHHFSQSFLLRPEKRMPPGQVRNALDAIVARHSMLRARFRQQEDKN